MKFSFTSMIKKVGINPCVPVPESISGKMKPIKGYIPVKGKIERHSFIQTLVPVKNEGYRLYVNGPMLKGAHVKVGDTVKFIIEQNFTPVIVTMPPLFKKELAANKLLDTFYELTPTRQKEVLKYLNALKTKESLVRNTGKFIVLLKKGEKIFR
jgi:hypothetical protein